MEPSTVVPKRRDSTNAMRSRNSANDAPASTGTRNCAAGASTATRTRMPMMEVCARRVARPRFPQRPAVPWHASAPEQGEAVDAFVMYGTASGWVRSIDATYDLVEVPEVRARYPALANKVESALSICESALQDYGVEHCALSFNGGKDCTVLAHILSAALRRHIGCARRGAKPHGDVPRIPALYVACREPFQEVEAFIEYAAAPDTGYHLALETSHAPMREALTTFIGGPGLQRDVRAMFVGVRLDDPHGNSIHVRAPCDPGWPAVMRVHPILDWDYTDVWAFLRCPVLRNVDAPDTPPPFVAGTDVGVPYCVLYDTGCVIPIAY